MASRAERRLRKIASELETLRAQRNRIPFHRLWALHLRQQDQEFTKKHARPKHDALVARIREHREEVKGLIK
jgi:hypothetical protein